MAIDQKSIFLASEGDAWLTRNANSERPHDPVLRGIADLQLSPREVVEIGCGSGWRLKALQAQFGCSCRGLDPATNLASPGSGITLRTGTAERLPYEDKSADLLIFGFCLYLTDPEDHFRIAMEADRVLADNGVLVVYDFAPGRPYKNPYQHYPGVFSRKMDYAELFLAHPTYRRLSRVYAEHAADYTFAADEAVAADFLLKDGVNAFPLRP